MKSFIRTALLATICGILHLACAQNCDLSGAQPDADFPDIEAEGAESYQMAVEYTLPGASQTDYYTEYYDILERRGRVDSIQNGKMSRYIYRTDSGEAWNINGDECILGNVTDIPAFYKSMQNEWTYTNATKPERKTMGPSAMFKIALSVWNTNRNGQMAYMGKTKDKIRGLNAQFWRRCDTKSTYVDYYFSTPDEENAFGLDFLKQIPLRVFFGGTREGVDKGLSEEQFEVISFQPFISQDVRPFVLPKGKGCKRQNVQDAPDLPDFTNKNIMFSAEVIYRVLDKTGEDMDVWSYYSTLTMALDITSQHLAYYYTPWNTSTPSEEPTVKAPVHVVFDMKHGYAYQYDDETGNCSITREKSFIPKYELPKNGGSVSLTDPSILFPNNELYFMSTGKNRGLDVNIFEEVVENYVLDKVNGDPDLIKKAIITHSYLQDTEVERNKDSVKNALTQVQMIFRGRPGKFVEILTFNFFGFSTQIRARRRVFNVQRCYKNDDDYVWVTLGFSADKDQLQKIKRDGPSIRSNILNEISLQSEVSAVRIPIILVDMDDGLEITLLILGKPPVLLDFLDPEEDKVVTGTTEVQGVSTAETCASNCLEKEATCWGFSICGAVCTYLGSSSATVSTRKGCQLYRRYNNDTFIPSKELLVENIQTMVQEHLLKLVLMGENDEMIQVEATSIEVTYPGEDDSLYDRIGNELNPRMRVLKAGAKLKTSSGSVVKNLGKLRYDECQRICLDFKDCETVSYCLKDSECVVSKKYGDDIKPDEMENNTLCNLLTRKYADHFDRSPGIVLSLTAKKEINAATVETCARACITETGFKCLSFDHCPQAGDKNCRLHTVHYPNAKTRESVQEKKPTCGHYTRKFSTEFKKKPEKRYVGAKVPALTNLTLEECAKSCIDYGKGACFGFDFCQERTILGTTCTLLDSDPSRMKSTYSPVCTNYLRTESQYAPRPYSTGYAGGIAFLCLLVGAVVGAVAVFVIAYIRVNRR